MAICTHPPSSTAGCQGHSTHASAGHGHAHRHKALPAPAPAKDAFLANNPCDGADFSEVCACCQGAIDVDELMGLKAAHTHDEAGSLRQGLTPRLPQGTGDLAVAGAVIWATAPGLWFGVQNYRAASKNVAALRATRAALAHPDCSRDLRPKAAPSDPSDGQVLANRDAYMLTLQRSISMQRFIRVFAGAMPLAGSACMLGSVVMPTLSVVGSAFMVLYCVSHICRYLGYEGQQTATLAQAMQGFTVCGAAASRGLQASTDQIAYRAKLYPRVAASFAIYGVGAGLLTASALCAMPSLIVPGVALLVPGLALVVYLNNFPIKAAFGHNQDLGVNRKHLGDDQAILRRIGHIEAELQSLTTLDRELRMATRPADARLRGYAWAVALGAAQVVSYATTFGICTLGTTRLRHRLRRHGIEHLQGGDAIYANHLRRLQTQDMATAAPDPASAAELHDRLFALRYERPEVLQESRAALLDHFHARRVLASGARQAA